MARSAQLISDSKNKLKKVSAILEAKAKQPKNLTLQQFIQALSTQIDKMLAVGYTLQEVAAILKSEGVNVQPTTIKSYLLKARAKNSSTATNNPASTQSNPGINRKRSSREQAKNNQATANSNSNKSDNTEALFTNEATETETIQPPAPVANQATSNATPQSPTPANQSNPPAINNNSTASAVTKNKSRTSNGTNAANSSTSGDKSQKFAKTSHNNSQFQANDNSNQGVQSNGNSNVLEAQQSQVNQLSLLDKTDIN
jgi:hypothetical protein